MTATTYKIVRFRFNGENQTMARGLSLAAAQEHCQREDTHGDGWFDGYDVDIEGDESDEDEAGDAAITAQAAVEEGGL